VSRIITLTTDFGTRDAYVAAMKGTMLAINPNARMVDISHEIQQGDVMEAALILRRSVPYFPPETVHLVVVDPGVGTGRRPVCMQRGRSVFVGPDNGVFPLLFGDASGDVIVELDRSEYWRTDRPSNTFHGRDIFAPVAAHVASGVDVSKVGSPITGLTPLHWALPIADDEGIRGLVLHVDHFGNCITNVTAEQVEARRRGRRVRCYTGSTILEDLRSNYAMVAPGEPLLLYDSSGYLEIAVNGGNASDLLGIRKGAPVNLLFVT